jgi:hypothetical protein
MSKRSVEKGDKGEKTQAQAQKAKPMDAPSVALEKKPRQEARPIFGRIATYICTYA